MLASLELEFGKRAEALECLRYYVPIAETHFWYEPEKAENARKKIKELKEIIG